MKDHNREEGMRRVNQAAALVASAIRLGRVRGDEVMLAMRSAVIQGAEQLAQDIREEADRG